MASPRASTYQRDRESFRTQAEASDLTVEMLGSHFLSLRNQNNVAKLIVYGFRTIALCRGLAGGDKSGSRAHL
jgi:hypothetical protein